jgi:hypothetical protein
MPNDEGLDARTTLHMETPGGEKAIEDYRGSPRITKD